MSTLPVDLDTVIHELREPGEHIAYLKGRWLDEREYEDFNEYIAATKKLIPSGYDFIKMTKGFDITLKRGQQTFSVRISVASIRVSTKKS